MVEVLTERAVGHPARQVLVGGADKAQVHGRLLGAAHGPYPPFLQGAEELHLHLVAEIAHLVEEERAAVGQLKGALLVAVGAGKRPFDVAEQLRCRHVAGDGAAVDGHKRPLGALALGVDAAGDILLSRAALAENEHRHGGGGDECDEAVELLRRLAAPLDVAGHAVFGPFLAAVGSGGGWRGGGGGSGLGRGRDGLGGQCLADLLEKDVGLEGLGDVVVGPRLHGEHGILHLRIARHHDEGRLPSLGAQLLEQLQAVVVGQAEVGEHQVGRAVLPHLAHRRAHGGDPLHDESLLAEPGLDQRPEGEVVLYDQYLFHFW